VGEASASLGLIGARAVAAIDDGGGEATGSAAAAAVRRVAARLAAVVCAPEPAEAVPSYLWPNTARCNAA
jgi:hypothetical protein